MKFKDLEATVEANKRSVEQMSEMVDKMNADIEHKLTSILSKLDC